MPTPRPGAARASLGLPALLLAATFLALSASSVLGCVFLMGEAPNSVATHPGGSEWNYAFRGGDWDGQDGKGVAWACPKGKKQSPVHLVKPCKLPTLANVLKTTWSYEPLKSNGSNIQIFNNGHTIQVQWLQPLKSTVKIQTTGNTITDVLSAKPTSKLITVDAVPEQFHFHTTSEHAIDGTYYPIEMHIVHRVPKSALPGCPDSGCLTVESVLFELNDDINVDFAPLNAIWDVMPDREGVVKYMPAGAVLDLNSLLPPKNARSYYQYEGSLTTPPCTEGILWHVFQYSIPISLAQYNKYSRTIGTKNCTLTTQGPTRRSLLPQSHTHSHTHDPLTRLMEFKKGAYTGFVEQRELDTLSRGPANRKLFEGEKQGNPDDWKCDIASYFFTNRNVQPLNGRPVYVVN